MHRPRLAFAILGLLVACQDGSVTAPPSSDVRGFRRGLAASTDDGAPVTYFAPRTIVREGSGPQTVEFPLQDRDHALFMEPFMLHVRAEGDKNIVGIVRVDGVTVIERRDLVALGKSTEPIAVEVPIGPMSVITVELQGPTGGSLTFWVDAPLHPPPVITITSPVRHAGGDVGIGQPGAFLQQGSLLPSPVEITGTACHVPYPITQLEVVGVAVPVSGTNLCEPFRVTQESRWGLSIITGTARNARGRIGTVVQSYARSPEYYPLAKNASDSPRIEGLYAQLNQSGLDDGDRSTVNDLATFVERNIVPIAIPARNLIPCTLSLFQVDAPGNTAFASVRVNSIAVTGSELAVDISVIRPSIDLVVLTDRQLFDGNCTGGNVRHATIEASSIRFTAAGAISLSPVNAPGHNPTVGVHLRDVEVTITGAEAKGLPTVDELVGLLAGLINSVLGDFVIDLLTPTISNLIRGFVPEIGTPVTRDITFNSASLRVTGGMQSILLSGSTPTGFIRSQSFGQATPLTSDPTAHSQLGAMRALCGTALLPCVGGTTPPPPFSATNYSFGLGFHQDIVNQLMWAAWRAGAFNLSDVSVLPGIGSGTLKAQSMSFQATMPPVSMASLSEDPVFEAGWGDVRVRSTFDPADVGAPAGAPIEVESWVSGIVRGALAFDAAAGRLQLTDFSSDVKVQLITTTLPFTDALLRAAIESDVRAALSALARSTIEMIPLDASVGMLGRLASVNVSRTGSIYIVGGSIQ